MPGKGAQLVLKAEEQEPSAPFPILDHAEGVEANELSDITKTAIPQTIEPQTSSLFAGSVTCERMADLKPSESLQNNNNQKLLLPAGLKPYYQENNIAIFLGDCRDILPHLPKVDLVLTDPPYGIDYQSAWRTEHQRKPKIHGDLEFPLWIFDILRPSVAMFVWCRWDILKILPEPQSFIAWDKCVHGMGDLEHEFGRQWEGCAFYPGPDHAFIFRPVDIIRAMRIAPDKLLHPNEKPTNALSPLITSHAGAILDPFMGSGTTLRAAKDLGRQCIGIEIEEKYAEIAARRLGQEVLPL